MHAVETGLLSDNETGRGESSSDKAVTRVSPMHQFHTLAQRAEDDGVLADDVPGSNGVDPDLTA
jgi:hypothetical protein